MIGYGSDAFSYVGSRSRTLDLLRFVKQNISGPRPYGPLTFGLKNRGGVEVEPRATPRPVSIRRAGSFPEERLVIEPRAPPSRSVKCPFHSTD